MSKKYLILAILSIMALFPGPARADVVVLKTGKKVEVEKVWRENGKIWIVYQGMRASIPQSKIERIESKSKNDLDKVKGQKKARPDINEFTSPPPGTHRLSRPKIQPNQLRCRHRQN